MLLSNLSRVYVFQNMKSVDKYIYWFTYYLPTESHNSFHWNCHVYVFKIYDIVSDYFIFRADLLWFCYNHLFIFHSVGFDGSTLKSVTLFELVTYSTVMNISFRENSFEIFSQVFLSRKCWTSNQKLDSWSMIPSDRKFVISAEYLNWVDIWISHFGKMHRILCSKQKMKPCYKQMRKIAQMKRIEWKRSSIWYIMVIIAARNRV